MSEQRIELIARHRGLWIYTIIATIVILILVMTYVSRVLALMNQIHTHQTTKVETWKRCRVIPAEIKAVTDNDIEAQASDDVIVFRLTLHQQKDFTVLRAPLKKGMSGVFIYCEDDYTILTFIPF